MKARRVIRRHRRRNDGAAAGPGRGAGLLMGMRRRRRALRLVAMGAVLLIGLAILSSCEVYQVPNEGPARAFDIRTGAPVPGAQNYYQLSDSGAVPQPVGPPAVQQYAPGYGPQGYVSPGYDPDYGKDYGDRNYGRGYGNGGYGHYYRPMPPGYVPGYVPVPSPGYAPDPGYSSVLACAIHGGDFIFPGGKNRQYQPVSFAVAPGQTLELPMVQDDGSRRASMFVQGDLSGVGVRICRYRPPEAGSNGYGFGTCGGFVASEQRLVRGVTEPLEIKDLFRGAKIECGFRSPPGVLPGRRPYPAY
jgi:hypothetical protein